MNNKIKTILLASLLVAMILPFSNMNVAEAATIDELNKKNRTEELKAKQKVRLEIRDQLQLDYNEYLELKGKIKNAEKKTVLSLVEKEKLTDNKNRHQEIKNKFEDRKKEQQKKNIPEAKLNKMMKQQDKFENALMKSKLLEYVTSVGIDLATKEIQVGLNEKKVNNSNIQSIISDLGVIMPQKAEWHVVLSDTVVNLSCSSQQQCAPLIGGNEIRIDNGESNENDWRKCSFGYKATKGTDSGIVTAGHCLDGLLNGDVHDTNGNAIGYAVSESYHWNTSCDCGWIKAGSSLIDNEIYLDSTTQTTITTTTTDSGQQNKDIVKSGRTTGATVGTVSAINVSVMVLSGSYYVHGLVKSDLTASSGDSGGTVVELDEEDNLYGVLSGKDWWGTYHQPQEDLNSVLGVSPVLG